MQPMIVIKWRDGKTWKPFCLDEINHMPRNHAIDLFSNNIQVVAKQDDTYIVNRQSIKDEYIAKGQKRLLFSELTPSDKPLSVTGLVGRIANLLVHNPDGERR